MCGAGVSMWIFRIGYTSGGHRVPGVRGSRSTLYRCKGDCCGVVRAALGHRNIGGFISNYYVVPGCAVWSSGKDFCPRICIWSTKMKQLQLNCYA